MYNQILIALQDAVSQICDQQVEVIIEKPKNPDHGDISCPVALRLSKILKKNPFEIAGLITQELDLPAEVLECHVVKPGFIKTKMTNHLKLPPLITSSPDQIANLIYKSYKHQKSVVYSKYWFLIMMLVKVIPEPIFKRMNF